MGLEVAVVSSLRERLLARERPSHRVPLQVEDPADAIREAVLAEDAWRTCHLMPEGPDRTAAIRKARRDLDRAAKAVNDCHEQITVRALPPEDFEALVAAHPPRDAKELKEGEEPDEAWNDKTFPRALFLACVDGDLSRAEWEKFLDGQCSSAERGQLYLAAQAVNVRIPNVAIPKD
jgi:hypothetical protein